MKSPRTEGALRVLVAPDSFKGCLGSVEVSEALASGVQRGWPEAFVQRLPMADGGEGIVTAVASSSPEASLDSHRVRGPDGGGVIAPVLWLPGRTVAIVELAAAAGLSMASCPEPVTATTWGVGELVAVAIAGGAERVVVGAGGSGTLDGGAGALQALGFSLLDSHGADIGPGVLGLESLRTIRAPDSIPAGIEILCDVQSPLLGPRGAARLYGPQKGATPELVERAEAALDRFAGLLAELTGRDPRAQPGSGAAGGFAGGLWGALGATLRSGFHGVADLVGLHPQIREADLVVTGEGRVDGQTGEGKLVAGVQSLCAAANVPLVVVAGQVTAEGGAWCAAKGVRLLELGDGARTVRERMERASELLEVAGRQVTRWEG